MTSKSRGKFITIILLTIASGEHAFAQDGDRTPLFPLESDSAILSERLARAIPDSLHTVNEALHMHPKTAPCVIPNWKRPVSSDSGDQPIRVDRYTGAVIDPSCRTVNNDDGFDLCSENGQLIQFIWTNDGRNAIVNSSAIGYPASRRFEFEFPGQARQEMEFHVIERINRPDVEDSSMQNTYIKFFPTRVLPSIRNSGDMTIVTLPTGERVRYKKSTHEIVDGVLSEGPLRDGAPADIGYSGAGVIVRADRRGKDPRIGGVVATITKPQAGQGENRSCRVPVSKLWTQSDDPRFRFVTDGQFDQFLRANCGFSLY